MRRFYRSLRFSERSVRYHPQGLNFREDRYARHPPLRIRCSGCCPRYASVCLCRLGQRARSENGAGMERRLSRLWRLSGPPAPLSTLATASESGWCLRRTARPLSGAPSSPSTGTRTTSPAEDEQRRQTAHLASQLLRWAAFAADLLPTYYPWRRFQLRPALLAREAHAVRLGTGAANPTSSVLSGPSILRAVWNDSSNF